MAPGGVRGPSGLGPRAVHHARDRPGSRGRGHAGPGNVRRYDAAHPAPEGGERGVSESRTVSLLICDDHKILTDALATMVSLDEDLSLVAEPVHTPEEAI